MPFDDSRRLTGSNLFFDSPGAVLETVALDIDAALLEGWRSRVLRARESLRWPVSVEGTVARTPCAERAGPVALRQHATGTSLAVAAPFDQLFTATEINEWALCAALLETAPNRWNYLESALVEAAQAASERAAAQVAAEIAAAGLSVPESTPAGDTPAARAPAPAPTFTSTPMAVAFTAALPVLDERAALARFATLAGIEAAPKLRALISAADARGLLHLLDDDDLTLGSGIGGHTWPVAAVPDVVDVPWARLRDVPAAIVTGSNGKTTTVRLLAACVRAHGWREGYNCTDGLFVGGEQIAAGDYSGPAGTRTVLRDTRVEAAILETARGGILRRGLAAQRARVAVVTNVSADHFGEYGIHDLAGLADVKLVVASTIDDTGLLVLNAEDPILRARANGLTTPIAWFARDHDHPTLLGHRNGGGSTSGVRTGRLIVTWVRGVHSPAAADRSASTQSAPAEEFDLGRIADMPLTVDGSADYNVSNIAGAALAALKLGISPDTIRNVLARFGADPADNPGRLMRFEYRGAQILIDYAHNPAGLGGLMDVAVRLRRTGRLALLLGQAGNRTTVDIERLVTVAARYRPDFVVIKEIESMLRGREPGEVPAIVRAALLREGLPESALDLQLSELAAIRRMLAWSQPGDVIVLPVHDRAVRAEALALIRDPR